MRRFSFWGGNGGPNADPDTEFHHERSASPVAASPINPQSTGGLWSSWWISSGPASLGKTAGGKNDNTSAQWYVNGITNTKVSDSKLVKHLISLRVHLSTAKLAWVEEFIFEEHGIDALGAVLSSLVGQGGKQKKLGEIESTVLLEIIKCMRVLLNTEPGFNKVIASPTIITHIAYSLHGSQARSKTLASELLAAICVVSSDGHKAVVAAMSDFKVAFDERFRFETLVGTLQLPVDDPSDELEGAEGTNDISWEQRTASMALVNAITNLPNSLEERVLFREEFGRRGLNELIVVSVCC